MAAAKPGNKVLQVSGRSDTGTQYRVTLWKGNAMFTKPALGSGYVCAATVKTWLLTLLFAVGIQAEQPYQIEWIAQVGTPDTDESWSVAVDGSGNAYITGRTDGSLGGPNAGGWDGFLTKFDPAGNELWSQQIGTPGVEYSLSVAVDDTGNVYTTGYTISDLGGPVLGSFDAFLMKFSPAGDEVWTKKVGTSSGDYSYSIAVDDANNAYISGFTTGSLGGPNMGDRDAFLTKFDSAGNELWSQQIGTTNSDQSLSVAVDSAGNAYISGDTRGNLGGPNEGNRDAFLTKFDTSGNALWTRQIGTTNGDQSRSVAVDSTGNAYISGNTSGSLGGAHSGNNDVFLTKFDPAGNELWSQQIGTADTDESYSVTVDATGNIYISGETYGSLGGPNIGEADAFLAKFDQAGTKLWSQHIGSLGSDQSRSVTVDNTGNVYISGFTTGALGGPNAGGYDAFLVKFTIPEPTTMTLFAVNGLVLLRRRVRN